MNFLVRFFTIFLLSAGVAMAPCTRVHTLANAGTSKEEACVEALLYLSFNQSTRQSTPRLLSLSHE